MSDERLRKKNKNNLIHLKYKFLFSKIEFSLFFNIILLK
jgi:hypothetical protein